MTYDISPWQTEPPEISFLKRLCVHESSHAVVQFLLGRESKGITIDPVKKYGKCSGDWRPDIGSQVRSLYISEIERRVLEFCAGTAGEAILTGSTGVSELDRQSADYHYSVEMLTPICENEEEINAYVALLLVRAQNLLNRSESWTAVVELANALILHTENDDNQDRCAMEYPSPENYLESGRGFRKMTGDEVEETIRYSLNKDEHSYDN